MISFKKVEDKDLLFIEKVYRSTREEELSSTNWSEAQKRQFIIMQSIAQSEDYKRNYKGAEHKIILYRKKPAGRLYLFESNTEIRIVDISLVTAFRNMGIGGKIITDIIELARQKHKNVVLSVFHNSPAKKLYEKLGFKKIGGTDTHSFMECKTT